MNVYLYYVYVCVSTLCAHVYRPYIPDTRDIYNRIERILSIHLVVSESTYRQSIRVYFVNNQKANPKRTDTERKITQKPKQNQKQKPSKATMKMLTKCIRYSRCTQTHSNMSPAEFDFKAVFIDNITRYRQYPHISVSITISSRLIRRRRVVDKCF